LHMAHMKQRYLLSLVFALLTAPCLFISCVPASASDEDILSFRKTKTIRYWGLAWKETPLAQRVAKAPDFVIDMLTAENKLQGFKERPIPAEPAPEFAKVLKRLEERLPDKMRELLADRVIGVFLVDHLGGTGFTEAVRDEDRKEKYAFIVLDRGLLLQRKANEWATWKESSVFKTGSDKDVKLAVVIETPVEDSVENAIRFILLHEIGHVLGMVCGTHPSWNEPAAVSDRYPFTAISWKMEKGIVASRYDDLFPARKLVRFYRFQTSSLATGQAETIYRRLFMETDFPSLQASVNIWEDFADSFALYVHVVREGRPHEIRLKREGQRETVYRPCWHDGRCEHKRRFFMSWFEDPTGNH